MYRGILKVYQFSLKVPNSDVELMSDVREDNSIAEEIYAVFNLCVWS